MSDYYIGLISGTSMDGIDAALVAFADASLEILHTHEHAYPASVRAKLATAMHTPGIRHADDVSELHDEVGACFRDAANALLAAADVRSSAVVAIGSHGQTIRHEPDADEPFSLQIGAPDVIAAGTRITTVADFRTADIALGGQGAPLAPAFHEWLFSTPGSSRVVANIGGISNITVLSNADAETIGFDTGPGNTLLDAWIREHQGVDFDRDGAWAASGSVDSALLSALLGDPYFAAPPPKSTGFEHFNLEWLRAFGAESVAAADVQATLCELTAVSLAEAIRSAAPADCELLVCGGGVHNRELMRRVGRQLPSQTVSSTAVAGLDPDWVEAAAFAWLAMRRLQELPGNLPSVTGASGPALLGTVHPVA